MFYQLQQQGKSKSQLDMALNACALNACALNACALDAQGPFCCPRSQTLTRTALTGYSGLPLVQYGIMSCSIIA